MKNTYPVLEKEQTDINLTPMLDVVFILLIFFVVTATFTRELGVDVYNPASAIPIPDDVQTISIVIEEDGQNFLMRDSVFSYHRLLTLRQQQLQLTLAEVPGLNEYRLQNSNSELINIANLQRTNNIYEQ